MWELVVVTCFGAREGDWNNKPHCEEKVIVTGQYVPTGNNCDWYMNRQFRIGSADYAYCRRKQVEK